MSSFRSELGGPTDRPAPQIEHPARPHTCASETYEPVGFGAIGTHWSPRRKFTGTLDDLW